MLSSGSLTVRVHPGTTTSIVFSHLMVNKKGEDPKERSGIRKRDNNPVKHPWEQHC